MTDEETVAFVRPRHLAAVWGRAFGQISDLLVAAGKSLLEFGAAEADIPPEDISRIKVMLVGGQLPRLAARDLEGETFGDVLPGSVVRFTRRGPASPGFEFVDCSIDESPDRPIHGDIYRGEVVDAQGSRVAYLALDAGS